MPSNRDSYKTEEKPDFASVCVLCGLSLAENAACFDLDDFILWITLLMISDRYICQKNISNLDLIHNTLFK